MILAGEVAGGHHYRRCNRNCCLGHCGLVGQPAPDDSREKGHRVSRLRLETWVSFPFPSFLDPR